MITKEPSFASLLVKQSPAMLDWLDRDNLFSVQLVGVKRYYWFT